MLKEQDPYFVTSRVISGSFVFLFPLALWLGALWNCEVGSLFVPWTDLSHDNLLGTEQRGIHIVSYRCNLVGPCLQSWITFVGGIWRISHKYIKQKCQHFMTRSLCPYHEKVTVCKTFTLRLISTCYFKIWMETRLQIDVYIHLI